MVDWHDPEVIEYCFFIYEQITVFLVGFYLAHFASTLNVEWELLTCKRTFRAVHVPYLLTRYITLAALLFFCITGSVENKTACGFVSSFFASLCSLAAMLSSLTIGFRPATMFYAMKYHFLLAFLFLTYAGQLALVVLGGFVALHQVWDDVHHVCIILDWRGDVLAAFYFYTFANDVVILLSTLYAIRCVHQKHSKERWGVGDILYVQGIGYVTLTCVVNIPVAVLATLDLNMAMDVMLSLPAMTFSVVASSRTLLALEDFGSKPNSRSSNTMQSTLARPSSDMELTRAQHFESVPTRFSLSISDVASDEVFDDDLARLASTSEPEHSSSHPVPL